jgi:hypothetical protein
MTAAILSTRAQRQSQGPAEGISDHSRKATLLAMADALQKSGFRFTTCTPTTHKRVNARESAAWATDLAGIFGWSRPFKRALPNPHLLDLMLRADAVHEVGDGFRSTLRASTLDSNLYLHSAYPTSAADAVFFGPDTYRFVRALRGALRDIGHCARAADIGCGAGPGAVTIACAYPAAMVFAVDINPSALLLTDVNSHLAGAFNVVPLESNLLQALDGEFDLIVSNPPYLLDREKRAYRHGGGDLGTGLSLAVVGEAISRLAAGGSLLLYTGVAIVNGVDSFRDSVAAMLNASDFQWTYEEIDPDVFGEELDEPAYASSDRIAAVWLRATKPGALNEQS